MFQLVYISSAPAPVTGPMLAEILHASRRNNVARNVTGLLVAGPRRFLQALEGPEAAVLETYQRIKSDPRHHALVMLTSRGVDTRAFGTWSMAFEQAGVDCGEADLVSAVDSLTCGLSDKSLRAHFMGFAEIHRRAA